MSGSATLYAEISGAGAPLVLLHGWAMNLRVFDGLRSRLAGRYAVSALDLPGHGASAWPADCSPARALELIGAALTAAVPPEATLIGWSLGGQLALMLAAARRARRLVLIASTARFAQAQGWEHGLTAATLQQFAHSLERDAGQTLAGFIDLQARGSRHAAAVRAALHGALETHGRAALPALRAGLALLADNDLRECARELKIPVLVIAGQNDCVVPLNASQALAALLPRAQLQVMQRAGHAPFLSHPDEVAAAVLQFLAATETAEPERPVAEVSLGAGADPVPRGVQVRR
ncbi:MAG TPA: alpha/beta fold hydrolase [Steroidobacteraceae bacterium]|nr:alpha/beta fold hydrolase [Steroidobacteraceae bacterium]